MKKTLFLFGILLFVFPLSCTTDYYFEDQLVDEASEPTDSGGFDNPTGDNTDDPNDDPSQNNGNSDDSATSDPYAGLITYQADVKPILNQLCVACHNSELHEDGVDLSTYSLAKANIDEILESMQESEYDEIMPPSGRVDDEVLQTLYSWVSDGLLEGEATEDNPDTGSSDGTYNYSSEIVAIINSECILCHGANNPAGGYDISTYQKVVDQIDIFLARIDLQTGQAGVMPPAGRMDEGTIQLIKDWVDQGMPE